MAEQTLISTMTKLQFLVEILADKLSYGYCRWLDERDYEDINDYAQLYKKDIEDNGGVFIKMTARPYGFRFTLDGKAFQAYCNSKEVGIRPLTK